MLRSVQVGAPMDCAVRAGTGLNCVSGLFFERGIRFTLAPRLRASGGAVRSMSVRTANFTKFGSGSGVALDASLSGSGYWSG